MGLRGPGSRKLVAARKAGKKKRTKAPAWKKRGLSRFERVLAFVTSLPVTKGPLAGTKFAPLPGQIEFLRAIYDAPSDQPVSLAILSEPRGNGKTGLIQALALCHLVGPEAVPRGELFAAAVDRTQSGKLFDEIEATLMASPDLLARVNIRRFHKIIEVLEGDGAGSKFEAMSGDARKGHGLAPSFFAYDELARVPDRDLLDGLLTGMGKRPCLGVILSTQAPDDDHPLSQLIDDAKAGVDPSVVLRLTCAPPDADPFDPETLRACNPALGHFLDEATLLKEQERARRVPALEPAFRNLRLNQRVDAQAEKRIVPAAVWAANAKPVDRAALRGRRCIGGLDLSGAVDLTALVLVFPSADADPVFDVLPFFWTPKGRLEQRHAAERQRFEQWIAAGSMTAIDGPVIRYSHVAHEIAALAKEFQIEAVAYDPYRIDLLKPELDEEGCAVPLTPFRQGFISMGPAVELTAELLLSERIRHGGHPVLTSCMANAIVVSDPAGNLKIDKGKSNDRSPVRVDGAVALAMALSAASTFEPPPPPPSFDWLKNPAGYF